MALRLFQPPDLYDLTVADLYTSVAQRNSQHELVQIIEEPTDEDGIDIQTRYTWQTVLQHAQNAARDLRDRSGRQARGPGDDLIVVGMVGTNGYDYYVNLLACALNRWTVRIILFTYAN